MKRVFIVHGWDGKPEHGWYMWLAEELRKNGFETFVPEMPNTEEPKIDAWVGKLKEIVMEAGEEDYFVGHSIGCQTILRYLETLNSEVKVGGCVFVVPWMHLDKQTLKEEGEGVLDVAKPWLESEIDFTKVKKIGNKFVSIFSDNDPYETLNDKGIFEEKLGSKIIVKEGQGHFMQDDGIMELPVALEEVLKISGKE